MTASPRPPRPAAVEGDLPPSAAAAIIGGVLALAALALFSPIIAVVVLVAVVVGPVIRSKSDVSVVLLVYAVALLLVPSRYTIGPYAITASLFLALVAGMLWGSGKLLPYSYLLRGRHPVVVSTVLFFAVMLMSAALNYLRPLSSLESRGMQRNLVILAALCGVVVALADSLHDRRRLDLLLKWMLAAGAVVAVIGIMQFSLGINLVDVVQPPGFTREAGSGPVSQPLRGGFRRIAGTARHPIEMGAAWALVFPLALHYARFAASRGGRQLAGLAAILIGAAIPMALSRTAVAAAGAVLLVVLPTWRLRDLARFAAIGAVGLVLFTAAVPGLLDTVRDMFEGEVGSDSIVGRAANQERALDDAKERPWLGRGFGSYDPTERGFIDNQYYEMLVETGVVGLCALGVLLTTGLLTAWGIRRGTDDPSTRDLAQTLAGMVVAIAVIGWGIEFLKYPMLSGLLFISLGSIAALSRLSSPSQRLPLAGAA